jgi:hypothetical protein
MSTATTAVPDDAGDDVPVFRVFVSSTFEDLRAERDALHGQVFPALRARCRASGARFQAVDLRWGVSEEAALDQRTMAVCLEEIRRCLETTPRPNFLVLLGDRYGWVPLPDPVPVDRLLDARSRSSTDDRRLLDDWYELDLNAAPPEYRLRSRIGTVAEGPGVWAQIEARLRRVFETPSARLLPSATEQEITVGALATGGANALLLLRDGARSDRDPRLTALRDFLFERLPADAVLPFGSVDELVALASERLSVLIDDELGHRRASAASVTRRSGRQEARRHEMVARSLSSDVVGRREELDRLSAALGRPSGSVVVVVGEDGAGKSSLLAAAFQTRLTSGPGRLLGRFIGATPTSGQARGLLVGLCAQLADAVDADAGDLTAPVEELSSRFAELAANAPGPPTVLILDDVGRLPPADLALVLPPPTEHLTLLLSTSPGPTLEAVRSICPEASFVHLGGLARADGAEALEAVLARAVRTLQPAQRAAVLDAFDDAAGSPLVLRLLLAEAQRWRSTDPIPSLPTDADAMIDRLFDGWSAPEAHGGPLVACVLGHLAAARDGLTEDELVELLSTDVEVFDWFLLGAHHTPPDLVAAAERHLGGRNGTEGVEAFVDGLRVAPAPERHAHLAALLSGPQGARVPDVLWSRFAGDLRPYLSERVDDEGNRLLGFFHERMRTVAVRRFVEPRRRALHTRLAALFRSHADPEGRGTWAGDVRGLSELPHHLIAGGAWDALHDLLTDYRFMEQKVRRVGRTDHDGRSSAWGVVRLQDDVDEALRVLDTR